MGSTDERRLYAWEVKGQTREMPVEPAPRERTWMDETVHRFAWRCLPLVVANQAGWVIRCPVRFTARWNGGQDRAATRIWFPRGRRDDRIISHFGEGIITFCQPYLFRTPPDINLWVKGPSNHLKDGIQPLEGVVETDWSDYNFTMNWKLTRPHHSVRFEEGEPFCMLVPVPRGLAESLQPIRRPLRSNPELHGRYRKWSRARKAFVAKLLRGDDQAIKQGWQRDYMLGRDVAGHVVDGHQTKLQLREFGSE